MSTSASGLRVALVAGWAVALGGAVRAAAPVAVAANGDPIPHPTATNTWTAASGAATAQVPEGMVYVPSGTFIYGTGTTARTVFLDHYCIGKFPVTEAEYKAFVDATHLSGLPSHWTGGSYPAGRTNHPVPNVSLTNALKYCAWVASNTGWNVTVPTADQWEKAARGTNGWIYPWGNTQGATYAGGVVNSKFNFNAVCAAYHLTTLSNAPAVYNNASSPYFGTTTTVGRIAAFSTNGTPTYLAVSASCAVSGWVNHDTWTGFIYTDVFGALNGAGGFTTPVGTFTNGMSPFGCHDMAGNLWAWTRTLSIALNGAEAGKLMPEVRGGSWYATGTSCRSFYLGEGRSGSGAYNTVGFRIVMIPPAPADTVGDGVPDWWRARWFGGDGRSTNVLSMAAGDPDEDGASNAEEYAADLDPMDASSRLALVDVRPEAAGTRVSWIGGSNAWHYLEVAVAPGADDWTPVFTNAPPTSGSGVAMQPAPASGSCRFYRVRAHRQGGNP